VRESERDWDCSRDCSSCSCSLLFDFILFWFYFILIWFWFWFWFWFDVYVCYIHTSHFHSLKCSLKLAYLHITPQRLCCVLFCVCVYCTGLALLCSLLVCLPHIISSHLISCPNMLSMLNQCSSVTREINTRSPTHTHAYTHQIWSKSKQPIVHLCCFCFLFFCFLAIENVGNDNGRNDALLWHYTHRKISWYIFKGPTICTFLRLFVCLFVCLFVHVSYSVLLFFRPSIYALLALFRWKCVLSLWRCFIYFFIFIYFYFYV